MPTSVSRHSRLFLVHARPVSAASSSLVLFPLQLTASCITRPSSKDEPQVSPTAFTFAVRGGPNVASNDRRMSDFTNYRRELAILETSRIPQIQHNPPTAGTNPHIAPWMTPTGPSTPSSTMPTSFYNDSSDNLSLASQGFQNPNNRASQPSQDFPDASYHDDRRPSAASILTASSQGSKTSITRGGFRKLQGFFGEEFPGRDSSESSLPTSVLGKDQRGRSYSHSRPTQRDRNYSNATDHTRDGSPTSSRPRTPVPTPEVVPFLYQDNSVCLFTNACPIPSDSQFHRPLSFLPPLLSPASAGAIFSVIPGKLRDHAL